MTHCKNGHALTVENTNIAQRRSGRYYRRCRVCRLDGKTPRNKITEAQVREIVTRVGGGESMRSVAEQYGITYSNVWTIMKGLTWTHVTGKGSH
jgi:hypothetical protein